MNNAQRTRGNAQLLKLRDSIGKILLGLARRVAPSLFAGAPGSANLGVRCDDRRHHSFASPKKVVVDFCDTGEIVVLVHDHTGMTHIWEERLGSPNILTEPSPTTSVRSGELVGDTAGKTPIRPTAAGRWVVRVLGGEEEIMNVIDIDENRERLFAVDGERLVRSVEWFSEVGGVEWLRPEAFRDYHKQPKLEGKK